MDNYIIKTDGTIVECNPADKHGFTLREMQKAVGGYIQQVGRYQNKSIWADEEGLLKELPLNEIASRFCFRQIVGDVLVCLDNLVK